MSAMPLFEIIDENDPDNYVWVHERARTLLDQYNLQDWTFKLSNEKRNLGRCKHYQREISFSSYYLHIDRAEIEDTILHEIAHALVGPKHGHDDTWRAKCRQLGCRPERLAPPSAKSSAQYNYVIECPTPRCGRKWYRHRIRKRLYGATCPKCGAAVQIFRLRNEP